MKLVTLFSTARSEDEAVKIINTLVSKRLIACGNIIQEARSIYRWKGHVCDETESLMIVKTRAENLPKVKAAFKKLHSYECPELVALEITDGLPNYLKWISDNTK